MTSSPAKTKPLREQRLRTPVQQLKKQLLLWRIRLHAPARQNSYYQSLAYYFRYVDDFVLVFEGEKDAEHGLEGVVRRLKELGLESIFLNNTGKKLHSQIKKAPEGKTFLKKLRGLSVLAKEGAVAMLTILLPIGLGKTQWR